MEAIVSDFWGKLENVLQSIAVQLLAKHPGFKFHIGTSENSAFPLRAYLSILKSNDGDELSITVDIKNREDGLLIESDVVGEEGVIVADGPWLELPEDLSECEIQVKVDQWLKSFECLFVEKSVDIDAAIKNLV